MTTTAPKRVLIGWELGGGLGHLNRLVPIIAALRSAGCDVIAAMRDLPAARRIFADVGGRYARGSFVLGQAPVFLHRSAGYRPAYSLPEIFKNIGFTNVAALEQVTGAWLNLIKRFAPDLVIADTAPSLLAVARGRVRTCAIGNGWAVPPEGMPIPALPLIESDRHASAQAETEISETFNGLEHSLEKIDGLADLLRGDNSIVCTPAVIDPYYRGRVEQVFWPPEIEIERTSTALRPQTALKVRMYLPGLHDTAAVIDNALAQLDVEAEAYLPGRAVIGATKLKAQSEPFDLNVCLPRTSCMIHHGGTGIAAFCLAYGVPQLVVPTDIEKALTAQALIDHADALTLTPACQPSQVVEALRSLLTTRAHKERIPHDKTRSQATIDAIKHVCQIY